MTQLEVFLIPGQYVVELTLNFFQINVAEIEPLLLTIFAGFISWIFWMAIIRAAWAVTLKMFGFDSGRRF